MKAYNKIQEIYSKYETILIWIPEDENVCLLKNYKDEFGFIYCDESNTNIKYIKPKSWSTGEKDRIKTFIGLEV